MPLVCSPMVAPFVWDYSLPLELEQLHRASEAIVGTHDFTSFAATDIDFTSRSKDPQSAKPCIHPVRTILHSAWQDRDGLLIYRVTANGFLHHMVRNLVGTFVEIGCGRLSSDAIPQILSARSRTAAASTAPARGLFLVEVFY